ncbi:hypothetical protein ES703_114108 [subsurface metagenome]
MDLVRIRGVGRNDYSGNWLGSGDLNQDGYDEIIINAHGFDYMEKRNVGVEYIIFGFENIISLGDIILDDQSVNMVRIFGKNTEDLLGALDVGDFNGDGIGDLLAGSLEADPLDRIRAGEGYIIYSSLDFQSRSDIDLSNFNSNVINIMGSDNSICTAGRVAAGDINGDGCDDAIISSGTHPFGREWAGTVYVVWGKNVITKVDNTETLKQFSLYQNNPNPFNPTTTIEFSLPGEGFTTLAIYNLAGQKIRELIAGNMTAGAHSIVWDGMDDSGSPVSSGIYFSRLTMGERTVSGRMVLVK